MKKISLFKLLVFVLGLFSLEVEAATFSPDPYQATIKLAGQHAHFCKAKSHYKKRYKPRERHHKRHKKLRQIGSVG